MTETKTATERLREMLDERGVDWDSPNSCQRDNLTMFVTSGEFGRLWIEAQERTEGILELTIEFYDELTPKQAIAATLGRERTCNADRHGGYTYRFKCSACGYSSLTHNCEMMMDELPSYCPCCGRKVVDR